MILRQDSDQAVALDGPRDDTLASHGTNHKTDIDIAALDVVAGPELADIVEVLRPRGRYVTCGAIADPRVELDMRRIYLKHLSLLGSSQGTRRNFAAVRDYLLSGAIRPVLAQGYPLAEIRQAQERFLRKDCVGKLAIEVQA